MVSSSHSGISKLLPSPALDANPNIILLMICRRVMRGHTDDTEAEHAATDIAKYVAMQNGLTTKGPYITSANFSFQNNIPGGHVYPTAEVSLYNFLRMAFAPN